MEFEYSYSYQSSTAKDSIYVSAKNIPLSRRDETYNELEYYLEGSETCSSIHSVLFTKLLDWPEADVYSTKRLTDFNCNEYSFFNIEFQ